MKTLQCTTCGDRCCWAASLRVSPQTTLTRQNVFRFRLDRVLLQTTPPLTCRFISRTQRGQGEAAVGQLRGTVVCVDLGGRGISNSLSGAGGVGLGGGGGTLSLSVACFSGVEQRR